MQSATGYNPRSKYEHVADMSSKYVGEPDIIDMIEFCRDLAMGGTMAFFDGFMFVRCSGMQL